MADRPGRAERTKCISVSADRRRQVATPRTLLPCRSSGGENTANPAWPGSTASVRSEEHTSELQSRGQRVCRLLLGKKKCLLYNEPTSCTWPARLIRLAEEP